MQDRELYEQLLGIKEPWKVSATELNVKERRVDVWVKHPKGIRWPCPACQKPFSIYDHAEERKWRHLDSCGFQTFLHARIPRIHCQEDGVLQVSVPWAEPIARFTALFERLAIEVLKQCDVSGATEILNISWDEAWHIMERAVERGHLRKEHAVPRHMGVDEKAIAKGHKYMTIVSDLEKATVEYVVDGRTKESLKSYYNRFAPEELTDIEAIAMDMWDPYMEATKESVPDATQKIVHDRFHIMGYMGEAVDDVRKEEHRELMREGDETLKGTRYLWLYNKENVPENKRSEFVLLKNQQLKVGRAWAIKESLRQLWSYIYPANAESFWKQWYFWATHSRLKPVIEAAGTLKRHITNILTYFKHRITNAVAEGLNSKIQRIKKMAYGFRNVEHFKTAIYFHCGGLNLYPC